MYLEFLKSLAAYIEALNNACKSLDGVDESMTGYINFVPVLFEDALEGFISDEIGGIFHYEAATGPEREWWDKRPWKRS